MARERATAIPASAEQRLEQVRGKAPLRTPTVRALAAYADHLDCPLATLGFAAGIDFDKWLAKTDYQVPVGQSPFAFRRGVTFEKRLEADGYKAPLDLLRAALGDPLEGGRVVNLRDAGTPSHEGMRQRARQTQDLLRGIVTGAPNSPHLIVGAVLQAAVGGILAHFEADGLAARAGLEIHGIEVKSFPRVDDRIDPEKLGGALDQLSFYLLLVRRTVELLGKGFIRLVSDIGMLITPRNTGLQPVLSALPLGRRIDRAEKVLDTVPAFDAVLAAAPPGLSFGDVADTTQPPERRVASLHILADAVGTAYKPGCLANCGNARFCRERAFRSGSLCLLGPSAERLMPGVNSLPRAEELTWGATPAAEERPTADLLASAGRLYDETAIL